MVDPNVIMNEESAPVFHPPKKRSYEEFLKPELIIKSIIPVVMAGILGIYGLIISVIISGSRKSYLPF